MQSNQNGSATHHERAAKARRLPQDQIASPLTATSVASGAKQSGWHCPPTCPSVGSNITCQRSFDTSKAATPLGTENLSAASVVGSFQILAAEGDREPAAFFSSVISS